MNATWEESKSALIDDSIAFGVGCTVLSVMQFIVGVICIDLMNFAALRQVGIFFYILLFFFCSSVSTFYKVNYIL